jgi:hypothetical protein
MLSKKVSTLKYQYFNIIAFAIQKLPCRQIYQIRVTLKF